MKRISRQALVPVLLFLLIVACSVVAGGWERWEVANDLEGKQEDSETVIRFKARIANEDNSLEARFNLAYIYYQQNKFDEAIKELREAQEKGPLNIELEKKVLFNLGNSLFRLSEGEKDLENSVDILKQSLDAYRNILEIEKSEDQFGLRNKTPDEDLIFNFTLARTRLKILLDELRKEAEQQQAQKTIYQLVQEIKRDEERVVEMTAKLEKNPQLQGASNLRKEILKIRSQLAEKVGTLKKKIKELALKQNKPSQPATQGGPNVQQHSPAMPLNQVIPGTI